MATVNQIFVNLPVKNLAKTKTFFAKLGFSFNEKFTDENATCMVIGENIFAMLLVEKFFQSFTKKKISDSTKTVETFLALSAKNRREVDDLMEKVLAGGGKETREAQDSGWMYGRAFEDLDGHSWEIFFMDESQMPEKP